MAEFLQASLVQTYLRDIACSDHCTKVSHNLYWWRALPSICRICNICEAQQNKGTSAAREEELVNQLEQTLAWSHVHRPNPCTVHWSPSVTLTPSQGTVKAVSVLSRKGRILVVLQPACLLSLLLPTYQPKCFHIEKTAPEPGLKCGAC